MDNFLELNKKKVGFAYRATAIILLLLALILLTIAYIKGQLPDTVLIITILLVAGLGFPVFIIFVGYLEWLSKRRVRKQAFSKSPFNELDKIGFFKSFINDKTRWYFTEETKAVIINDFIIQCNITREKSKIIEFKAFTKPRQIEKNEIKILKERFKQNNIEFDWYWPTKLYDIRRPSIESIQQLKSDLEQFTKILKQENFEPER